MKIRGRWKLLRTFMGLDKKSETKIETVKEPEKSLGDISPYEIEISQMIKVYEYQGGYENFLDSEAFQSLTTHRNRIVKMKEEIGSKYIGTEGEWNKVIAAFSECFNEREALAQEITSFLMEAEALRNKITDYSNVINQIKSKKLKKEELIKVKEKLDPKVEELRKEREHFLELEKVKNEKINAYCLKVKNIIEKVKELIG